MSCGGGGEDDGATEAEAEADAEVEDGDANANCVGWPRYKMLPNIFEAVAAVTLVESVFKADDEDDEDDEEDKDMDERPAPADTVRTDRASSAPNTARPSLLSPPSSSSSI